MSLLNRDAILAADDLASENIAVPEWGEGAEVKVRCMTAEERDEWDASIYQEVRGKVVVDRKNFRAKLLAKTIVDESGVPIFSESDIETLGKKSSIVITRLFITAQRINGLSKEAQEALEKN